MSRLNDQLDDVVEFVLDVDDDHLRSRHHDFPSLGFRYFEHAGEHAFLFVVEFDIGLDKGLNFIAAPGLTLDCTPDACKKSGSTRAAGTWRFVVHMR